MANTIVIYFSHSANDATFNGPYVREKGNTQIAAEAIKDALSCDIFRVELSDKYKGMAWYTNKEKLRKTMSGKAVEVKKLLDSISEYANVFICGPCWWGSYPTAIFAQIKKLKFKGKRVMCLVTHEDSNPEGCLDIQKKLRGAKFGRHFLVRGDEVHQRLPQIVHWACVQNGE